ncbi:SU10 major capsid protein [Dysgonomonas termitidis]|uniref:Uncharacterized protein n=1 Tax=Dysgonomonas termitidis TaxID=1516126 RepID=A0ABV9L1N2_9BACT
MKEIFKNYFGKGGLIILLLSLACAIIGVTDAGSVHAAEGIFTPNNTGADPSSPGADNLGKHVAGEVSVDTGKNVQSELLKPFYDDEIIKVRPDKAILDTMLRHMTPRNTNSIEAKWGSVDIKPFETFATSAYTQVTTSSTAVLTVDNPIIFAKSSTIRVKGVYGYDESGTVRSTKVYLQLRVKSIAGNQITVYATNGGALTGTALRPKTQKFIPSIPANTKLFRLGRAATEFDVKTPPTSSYPTIDNNYAQTFMCQIDVSKWYQKQDKILDWEKEDMNEAAIFEWRMEMEGSLMYGEKGMTYDDDQNVDVYTCNGITKYMFKEYEYTTFTKDDFVDMLEYIFTKNSGSKKRAIFAGSKFISNVSKIDWTLYKDITTGTDVQWGIEWTTIRTNFGTLYLIHHELLDLYDDAENAYVLDPDYLYKYIWEARTTKQYDQEQLGVRKSDTTVNSESFCVGLGYPSCHCKIMKAA